MLLNTQYMQRALDLAGLGHGKVSPNPMVGAVIVYENKIIGEGWHKQYGGPHAEVEAIKSVSDQFLLPDSTMYVTLEPCSHYGKTPPCADLIIEKKVRKVVIAMQDPNPFVAGKGMTKLKNAGIETEMGILEKKATSLNKRFLTNILKHRPYVILKWAQSADGFLAPGLNASKKDKQISNELSQQLVHTWRAQEDAIMIGYNTLQYDNPKLNVRLIDTHRQPTRITWDEKELSAGNYNFFDGSQNSFVFNYLKDENLESHRNLQILQGENSLSHLLTRLLQEGIGSVLVEGGLKLLTKFVQSGLWDEARICTSPNKIINGISAPEISAKQTEKFNLQGDEWKVLRISQV